MFTAQTWEILFPKVDFNPVSLSLPTLQRIHTLDCYPFTEIPVTISVLCPQRLFLKEEHSSCSPAAASLTLAPITVATP